MVVTLAAIVHLMANLMDFSILNLACQECALGHRCCSGDLAYRHVWCYDIGLGGVMIVILRVVLSVVLIGDLVGCRKFNILLIQGYVFI
jgi:hypothetical protein